jgi:transcription elongation GreA/GreB family factor
MNQAAQINPWSPDYALTPEGLGELQAELRTLRGKRGQISGDGTLPEEQHVLETRIATLEEIVEQAWTIDPSALEPGVVAIGTHVELRDVDSNRSERYRVVGKHEPLRAGELSAASAIGNALVGRCVGETVSVDLPNGHARRLKVMVAEPQAQSA